MVEKISDSKYEIINITEKELLNYAHEVKEKGYRLVQISCTRLGEIFELNYSFGKDYDFLNYRIEITSDVVISSISSVFSPAFFYENELKDLFGINIDYISLDYKGKLYNTAIKTPFASNGNEEVHKK